jgi:Zn-finger nucleic acid-binding protein
MTCPACAGAMTGLALDGHYGRTVQVDVCQGCAGLWVDGHELLQLTAGATLTLFRHLGAWAPAARRPAAEIKPCPRCGVRLARTLDRREATAHEAFRCRKGHGRYLTYGAFLRARHFVRDLAPREVKALARHVQSVKCVNCGAGIDIRTASACPYCRAAIAVVDPDQLQRTVKALQEAEASRGEIDPTWPLEAARVARQTEQVFAELQRHGTTSAPFALLDEGLAAFWRVVDAIGRVR